MPGPVTRRPFAVEIASSGTRIESGRVDHRDDERAEYLTPCVSRCDDELLVLAL